MKRYILLLSLCLAVSPLFSIEQNDLSKDANTLDGLDSTSFLAASSGTAVDGLKGGTGITANLNLVNKIIASYLQNTAVADGNVGFSFITTATVSAAASAEVNGGKFEYNWIKGDNANNVINALEGVARSQGTDESLTMRGLYGRFYIDPAYSATLRTGVGVEAAARASYSGGTAIAAESGTAFVGSRIWMAPYFTNTSTENINNFHGLWLYNEHPTVKVTNGIKIDGSNAGFENDIVMQNGEYLRNTTNGVISTDAILYVSTIVLTGINSGININGNFFASSPTAGGGTVTAVTSSTTLIPSDFVCNGLANGAILVNDTEETTFDGVVSSKTIAREIEFAPSVNGRADYCYYIPQTANLHIYTIDHATGTAVTGTMWMDIWISTTTNARAVSNYTIARATITLVNTDDVVTAYEFTGVTPKIPYMITRVRKKGSASLQSLRMLAMQVME